MKIQRIPSKNKPGGKPEDGKHNPTMEEIEEKNDDDDEDDGWESSWTTCANQWLSLILAVTSGIGFFCVVGIEQSLTERWI